MKTNAKPLCLTGALLTLATGVLGQTLTSFVTFNGSGNGANPQAGLLASGNTLYGTASAGGVSNAGTVFAYNISTGNLSNVYVFSGGNDGRGPVAGMILSSNTLYGTTAMGGTSGNGAVFAVNTNGGGFTNIHSFTGGTYGADPEAGLVLLSNTLFGTTFIGGASGDGSIFRVNTDGTDFTNIYSFSGGTNGSNPMAGLVLSGNTLYGTTYGPYYGGTGFGTVFSVQTDGSGFSNVYSFKGSSDGAYPEAGLALSGNMLYGTANAGGLFGNGTVFMVETNGNGFSSLVFNFTDGANPQAGLLLAGNLLYGTTVNGGTNNGWGTIFQVNTNLGGITDLYSFGDGSDGASPEAGLALLGNTLYGTTQADTDYGDGTLFGLTAPGLVVPIALNIALNGNQVTLSWGNAAFALQSCPTVNGAYTNVTGAASPYTTALPGQQLFFRLVAN